MVLCLATAQITLERKQIYFSVLDIDMELHGRSGGFFSDLTILLFVFSVTENPVTSPTSSLRFSEAGGRSCCH